MFTRNYLISPVLQLPDRAKHTVRLSAVNPFITLEQIIRSPGAFSCPCCRHLPNHLPNQ